MCSYVHSPLSKNRVRLRTLKLLPTLHLAPHLGHGTDMALPVSFEDTQLVRAIKTGDHDAARMLVDRGADVNAANKVRRRGLGRSFPRLARLRLCSD